MSELRMAIVYGMLHLATAAEVRGSVLTTAQRVQGRHRLRSEMYSSLCTYRSCMTYVWSL